MTEILLFGRLRDTIGTRALSIDLPRDVRDTETLRAWLGGEHPDLLDLSVRIAVNAELTSESASIAADDEIAFLPPMSGG